MVDNNNNNDDHIISNSNFSNDVKLIVITTLISTTTTTSTTRTTTRIFRIQLLAYYHIYYRTRPFCLTATKLTVPECLSVLSVLSSCCSLRAWVDPICVLLPPFILLSGDPSFRKGAEFVAHNKKFLSRIYPSAHRVLSGNYNPTKMWAVGCQLVALNYQVISLSRAFD